MSQLIKLNGRDKTWLLLALLKLSKEKLATKDKAYLSKLWERIYAIKGN